MFEFCETPRCVGVTYQCHEPSSLLLPQVLVGLMWNLHNTTGNHEGRKKFGQGLHAFC